MIVLALLISCRLQFSKSDSHSKRENRQPLQQGLPTKCFGDHLQVRVIHLELLSFFHLLSTQYKRQVTCSLHWTSSSHICTCETNAGLRLPCTCENCEQPMGFIPVCPRPVPLAVSKQRRKCTLGGVICRPRPWLHYQPDT